jgi:hypothetical protein
LLLSTRTVVPWLGWSPQTPGWATGVAEASPISPSADERIGRARSYVTRCGRTGECMAQKVGAFLRTGEALWGGQRLRVAWVGGARLEVHSSTVESSCRSRYRCFSSSPSASADTLGTYLAPPTLPTWSPAGLALRFVLVLRHTHVFSASALCSCY